MSYGYGQQQMHHPPGGQMGQVQQQMHQQHMHAGGGFQQNVFAANAAAAANALTYMNFNSQDDLHYVFQSKVNPTLGGIQGQELHQILNEHEHFKRTYGITWSLELCKIMLAMMDRDKNGMMKFGEFMELLQCLVYWHQTFVAYDMDRSGYIESIELHRVISEKFKYRLSQQAMTTILKRYARVLPDGRCIIAFDDFVALSVRLRAYTEAFRARDKLNNGQETGTTSMNYDDFLQCVLCL